MRLNTIEYCSKMLAKEISQRSILNIDEIRALIYTRVSDAMLLFIEEYKNVHEREYEKTLNEQVKTKLNTPQYHQLGQKLSVLKHKKASSNRVLHEMKKDARFFRLRDFVTNKFGQEVMVQFEEQLKQNKYANPEVSDTTGDAISATAGNKITPQ